MKYIRQIHLENPATSSEHISRVNHSDTPTGPLSESSRTRIVQQIAAGTETFQSRSPNGTQAPVVVKTSEVGIKYITTVSDGRENNNLLSLPQY